MNVKKFIRIVLKYKLYIPIRFVRFCHYNFHVVNRVEGKYMLLSSHSIFDLHDTATINLSQEVDFGWCNMKKSRLETALCMAKRSMLQFGGGKNIKQIQIGYGSYIQVGSNACLKIGDSFVNREVKIICNQSITIGDECIIAMGTVIRDNDGGTHRFLSDDYINSKPIVIQNHVWIGENVMVLKGVTIGEGSVVGANSLVTKDIPPHCLAIGSPAKVVRENISWEV